MSKNILITGAAGFIGFHLARYLAKRGDCVLGYDNFNDYYTPQLKRDRAKILAEEGISVGEADICDLDKLQEAMARHETTHLVHLAAQAGVRYSLQNPQAYIRSNIEGFTNVLEAVRASPEIKLTYASSSSVYGLNTKVPFSTEDRVDQQASFYGATKRSNELMAHSYHHLFNLSVTGLRFFTVYGPWGRPDMAYYQFADSIMEGRPIEVFNHGKMQRDFTYIDDIVQGTTAAIDLESPCEVFNLGNHQPVELEDFISTLEEALGQKAEKIMKPMQAGDVHATYADIEKSREMLGFQPKTDIATGLQYFIDWYKTHGLVYNPNLIGC